MALTTKMKLKIITQLGWPAKTIVVSSTHYNSLVVDRLNNLTPEIESLILSTVTSLDAVNTKLSVSLGKAGLKRIGDIEFFEGGQAFIDLKNERNRYLNELSDLVDIKKVKSGGVNINIAC